MTPETSAYMRKARESLDEARKIMAIGLAKAAARSAYYAVFHAAEAFIVELTGKTAKTHSGVRSEFARLAKDDPRIEKAFSSFLAQAYKYKEIDDYSIDPNTTISLSDAEDAINTAQRFADCVADILGAE